MISSGLKYPFRSPGFFHWADHILSCRHHVVWLGSAHEMHEKLGRPKWTEGQEHGLTDLFKERSSPAWCVGVCLQSWWMKDKVSRATFLPSVFKQLYKYSFLAQKCLFAVQKDAIQNSPSHCLVMFIYPGLLWKCFLIHEFQSVHLSSVGCAWGDVRELVYMG